jgi:hypothetical protein
MLVILQRELLKESRRSGARSLRMLTSAISLASCLFLLLTNRDAAADGRRIFYLLTFAGFAFSLIQGVWKAAGAICDEKRDGTLSLLLMTSLTPSEVLLGKFIAVGLPVIQPFLGFIPALALSGLEGGVTGAEIFRAIAVVASALVFSVATGLCVSSFSRRNERVGLVTLGVMGSISCVPLFFARGSFGFLRMLSPWTAFTAISDTHYGMNPADFWLALLTLQYFTIALLITAVFFLPRRWESRSDVTLRRGRSLIPKFTPEERGAILDRSPAAWLAIRDGRDWDRQIPFLLLLALSAGAATILTDPRHAFIALMVAAIILLVRLAAEASSPLCNARRSGAMEMMLCTPLEPYSLVVGLNAALWRQFAAPFAIVLAGGFFYFMRDDEEFSGMGKFILLGAQFGIWTVSLGSLGVFVSLLESSPASALFQTILIGIVTAGLLSIVSGPFPFLLLLGLSGNRLASNQLSVLLKRPSNVAR